MEWSCPLSILEGMLTIFPIFRPRGLYPQMEHSNPHLHRLLEEVTQTPKNVLHDTTLQFSETNAIGIELSEDGHININSLLWLWSLQCHRENQPMHRGCITSMTGRKQVWLCRRGLLGILAILALIVERTRRQFQPIRVSPSHLNMTPS